MTVDAAVPLPEIDAAGQRDLVDVTRTAIDEPAIRQWLTDSRCGAVVVFAGVVRENSAGYHNVTAVEYEAYEEPTGAVLRQLIGEARAAWPDVVRLALVHRIGVVRCTEPSVVIGVSSPHRRDAFEATEFLIDVLKHTAPIWKYEHAARGSGWGHTGVQPLPVEAAARRWHEARR